MKQGRTLPELAAELQRQFCGKRDLLAPAELVRVKSNGHTDLILNEAFEMNEIAHGQLAEYIGAPKAFYDRLRNATGDLRVPFYTEGRDDHRIEEPLFDVVVNKLLKSKGPESRLVRTLDGTARAFLSGSYSTDLDHYDVLRVAVRAMEEAGLTPENVVSCEVTERRLYLKVVSPKLEAVIHPSNLTHPHGHHHMLKEPEVVQAGFILTNSETGLGSLSIQQTVIKLMCTNLWIREEAYKQRHLGRALEADDEGIVYKSDTRKAEATARLLKIRDHVAEALDETKFKALTAKMQDSADIRLEGKIDQIVEVTARKFGLSLAEKDDVLKNLIDGADLSLWGLSNAITAAAQTVPDYDRATDLEAIGGRFFALPKAKIREIVTAA